jgi:DNA-directed RNA polymerase specialized sigma24 family protein
MQNDPQDSSENARQTVFPRTLWTEWVEPAREGNSAQAETALRQLCAAYREPILVWLKRRGTEPGQAEDLTHGFIEFLLERNRLGAADRQRASFRAFLLTCLKRYVRGVWRGTQSRPPGADQQTEPLEEQSLPGVEEDLARALDREFALAVHRRAVERLRQAFAAKGNRERFRVLQPFILGAETDLSCAEVGQQVNLTPNAVKKAVFDLRDAYYDALRAEIMQTVASREVLEEEMRYLVSLLAETEAVESPDPCSGKGRV